VSDEADPVLVTPDGRYVVIRGRLWRRSDPRLSPQERQSAVDDLMAARRAVASARRRDDAAALAAARSGVQVAKERLGERGTVWWDDGEPDLTRHLARTTGYAQWYASLPVDR
jgi:hypothetical protein